MNKDKVFSIKFHNRSIYSNIKDNKAKLELISVDFLCYTLVRQKLANASIASTQRTTLFVSCRMTQFSN